MRTKGDLKQGVVEVSLQKGDLIILELVQKLIWASNAPFWSTIEQDETPSVLQDSQNVQFHHLHLNT